MGISFPQVSSPGWGPIALPSPCVRLPLSCSRAVHVSALPNLSGAASCLDVVAQSLPFQSSGRSPGDWLGCGCLVVKMGQSELRVLPLYHLPGLPADISSLCLAYTGKAQSMGLYCGYLHSTNISLNQPSEKRVMKLRRWGEFLAGFHTFKNWKPNYSKKGMSLYYMLKSS